MVCVSHYFSITDKEDAVKLIMQAVGPQDLKNGAWGGKVWAKLKRTGSNPGWSRLSNTTFWSDGQQYGILHKMLRGETSVPSGILHATPQKQRNEVLRIEIIDSESGGGHSGNANFSC